jgi:hypothetical protein
MPRRFLFPRTGRSGLALLPLLLSLAACDNPSDPDGRSGPRVALSAPAGSQSVDGDSVVVEGTATDRRTVERVAFRLNGGAEQPVEVTPGKSVAFRFVARGLEVGPNQLEVLAYGAGERVGSAGITLSIRDVKSPALLALAPAEGELVGRDSVRVSGRATDDRRVASLAYSLDGGADVAVPVTPGAEVAFAFTVRGTAPGVHTLALRARDAGGNETVSTLRFTSGTANLWLTTPAMGQTVDRFAAGLVAVVESPVAVTRFTYSLNGGAEVPMCLPMGLGDPPQCRNFPAGRNTLTWTADALPQGDVRIRVTAYAGDQAVAAGSAAVRVDVPVRRYRVLGAVRKPGWYVVASDLNDGNQVAGYVSDFGSTPSRTRPYLWADGVVTDVDQPVYTPGPVFVNNLGQVAGTKFPPSTQTPTGYCAAAFLWVPGGAWKDLRCGTHARGLNDRGNVLVNMGAETIIEQAHLWSPATESLTRLVQSGYDGVVGFALGGEDVAGVMLYRRGETASRIALVRPGQPPVVLMEAYTGPCGSVVSFDDPAQLVCTAGIVRNGQVAEAPPPLGVGSPAILAVNSRKETVGVYTWRGSRGPRDYGQSRAFYWAGGKTYDIVLDDPSWTLQPGVTHAVIDLNESGVVLANAFNRTTQEYAPVLLAPIP